MHKQLIKLLPDAEGSSCWVVAMFIDVRDFSSFATEVESVQTALFLKRLYLKLIQTHLADAAFIKPTGDGLMAIFEHSERDVIARCNDVLTKAVAIIEEYPTMFAEDEVLNFQLPKHIGIGLARGAATKLRTTSRTLDYSGRPLNLAARLMDLARPKGVVFDESFGPQLLEADLSARFKGGKAYIKGIAELKPMTVFVAKSWSAIPRSAQTPIGKFEWFKEPIEKVKFKDLEPRGNHAHRLGRYPAFPDEVRARISHRAITKSGAQSMSGVHVVSDMPVKFEDLGEGPTARIDYRRVRADLEKEGVKSTWPVEIAVSYQVVPDVGD